MKTRRFQAVGYNCIRLVQPPPTSGARRISRPKYPLGVSVGGNATTKVDLSSSVEELFFARTTALNVCDAKADAAV
jgi:hypothetical protein